MTRRRTKQERKREVAAWRVSGQSQAAYARARGYSPVSLARWAGDAAAIETPAFVRLEVTPAQGASANLVVEVGSARVHVGRGFDPGLLREVVAALTSERSS